MTYKSIEDARIWRTTTSRDNDVITGQGGDGIEWEINFSYLWDSTWRHDYNFIQKLGLILIYLQHALFKIKALNIQHLTLIVKIINEMLQNYAFSNNGFSSLLYIPLSFLNFSSF